MSTATIHPLTQALADAGVTLAIESRPSDIITDKEGWKHYAWSVRLVCGDKRTSAIPYKMGTAHVVNPSREYSKYLPVKPKAPSAEDVVSSMVLDSSACDESFDDWCATFGYDTDSRKALETYLACQNSGAELRKVLGKHLSAIVDAAQEW